MDSTNHNCNCYDCNGHYEGHHGYHESDHQRDYHRPIRYLKLQNHGAAAIIHFLINDETGDRIVFEGGPTLPSGYDGLLDLSTTAGIDNKAHYHFGAAVTAGRKVVDKFPHAVDFGSSLVGVWTWRGTAGAGSRVVFEGYEERGDEDGAADELLRLERTVKMVQDQMASGGFEIGDLRMIETWAKLAGEGIMGVVLDAEIRENRRNFYDNDPFTVHPL